jgi:hypothetical protein
MKRDAVVTEPGSGSDLPAQLGVPSVDGTTAPCGFFMIGRRMSDWLVLKLKERKSDDDRVDLAALGAHSAELRRNTQRTLVWTLTH